MRAAIHTFEHVLQTKLPENWGASHVRPRSQGPQGSKAAGADGLDQKDLRMKRGINLNEEIKKSIEKRTKTRLKSIGKSTKKDTKMMQNIRLKRL